MKRILLASIGLLLYCSLGWLPVAHLRAAWDKGFNFRDTAAFTTDGANETYVTGTDSYPTTRNTVTFGWDNIGYITPLNHDAGLDRRLAGRHFINGSPVTFQVDLTASGNYNVSYAIGHPTTTWSVDLDIYDNLTLLAHITGSGNADEYQDATGTKYSAATWPGSNSPVTYTFATTTCKFTFNTPAGDGTRLEHILVSQVAAAVGGTPHLSLLHGGK